MPLALVISFKLIHWQRIQKLVTYEYRKLQSFFKSAFHSILPITLVREFLCKFHINNN